jgi:microcompartment protein CcmL/EutN
MAQLASVHALPNLHRKTSLLMPKTMQLRKENMETVKISKSISTLKVNLAAAHIMSAGRVCDSRLDARTSIKFPE